jgi:hypothetical protein
MNIMHNVLAMRGRYFCDLPKTVRFQNEQLSEYMWFTDHGSVHIKRNFVPVSC